MREASIILPSVEVSHGLLPWSTSTWQRRPCRRLYVLLEAVVRPAVRFHVHKQAELRRERCWKRQHFIHHNMDGSCLSLFYIVLCQEMHNVKLVCLACNPLLACAHSFLRCSSVPEFGIIEIEHETRFFVASFLISDFLVKICIENISYRKLFVSLIHCQCALLQGNYRFRGSSKHTFAAPLVSDYRSISLEPATANFSTTWEVASTEIYCSGTISCFPRASTGVFKISIRCVN